MAKERFVGHRVGNCCAVAGMGGGRVGREDEGDGNVCWSGFIQMFGFGQEVNFVFRKAIKKSLEQYYL